MVGRILVADIGGTNCRFGVFKYAGNALTMVENAWVNTVNIRDEKMFIAALECELQLKCVDSDIVVVAIAGPVEENSRGALSNGALHLDFRPLNSSGQHFSLINDFTAQAYAVISPHGATARQITGPEKRIGDRVRAVIGAGTGLGQAMLIRQSSGDGYSGWLTVPSENGHGSFPFVNSVENDFHKFLCHKLHLPYATGDDTITGRGLAALHEFLTGQSLDPAQIGVQALSYETTTLEWYARLYARACRNWILATMCEGGLWIAGGIAAQNPLVVTSSHFTDELYNAPRGNGFWGSFLRGVPVYLLEDTNSGLWGAACFGLEQLQFLLTDV